MIKKNEKAKYMILCSIIIPLLMSATLTNVYADSGAALPILQAPQQDQVITQAPPSLPNTSSPQQTLPPAPEPAALPITQQQAPAPLPQSLSNIIVPPPQLSLPLPPNPADVQAPPAIVTQPSTQVSTQAPIQQLPAQSTQSLPAPLPEIGRAHV